MPRDKTWKCSRQAQGVKCGASNPNRKQLCGSCGKRKPARKKPAHMAALKLTYEQYVELNGGEHCGICGVGPPENRRLDRDHDHATSLPRGLLCRKHNRMLKRWLTDDFMRLALAYLERTA